MRSEASGPMLALAGFACLSLGDAVVKGMAGLWLWRAGRGRAQ